MEVDQPAPVETTEGDTKATEKKEEKAAPVKKAYVAQVDPISGDLVPECTAYLRLLLILANLDANRVKEVRHILLMIAHS